MYYGDDNDRAKRIASTAAEYREAAALFAPIRGTLAKFDGKVYNKRFLAAAHAAADGKHIAADVRGECVYIYHYSPILQGVTVCKIVLTDGKRIDGIASAQSAAEYRTRNLQQAAELDIYAQPEALQEIKSRVQKVKALYNAVVCDVPSCVLDACNIKRYIY